MKGRLTVFIVALILLAGFTQCKNKNEKKIIGIWQLQAMVINGSVLKGSSLGSWLWEFNAEGGYLTEIAGMKEKGTYKLKDSVLTLNILIPKHGPSQVYKVLKLDTAQLDLFYYENRNQSTLHFVKRNITDVEGEDKD